MNSNDTVEIKIIKCPCENFESIESIINVLNNDSETESLRNWISGKYNNEAFQQKCKLSCGKLCCKKRGITSLLILNNIRDTCRPFVEVIYRNTASSARKDAITPRKISIIDTDASAYESSFPALQVNNATKNNKNYSLISNTKVSNNTQNILLREPKQPTKNKRRIRPITADFSPNVKGNLVGLPSEELILPPPPPGFGQKIKTTEQNVTFVGNVTALDSYYQSQSIATNIESNKNPEILIKSPITPVKRSSVCKRIESNEEMSLILPLSSLIDVYCGLIQNCLVPSTASELQLLLRLLSLSTTNNPISEESTYVGTQSTSTGISSILKSTERCLYFAIQSLRKLATVIKGFCILFLTNLTKCTSFQANLPDLTEDILFEIRKRASTSGINISMDQTTALFTLPIKEDRDSRNNYKTSEGQLIYNNREISRDAFFYQLRAFLNVKGKLINNSQNNKEIQKTKQSASDVVKGLVDSNISWFAEIFCDLLLQIGLVPIQETDKDLLNIADKDKLQKLHNRFSTQSSNVDRSTKKLLIDPRKDFNGSLPSSEAQKSFPGHQEFFFNFILSADSYNFGLHLRSQFIEKINEIYNNNINNTNAEKKLLEICLLSKFVGLLIFYPNWSTWNVHNNNSEKSLTLDGLYQLSVSGLPLLDLLHESVRKKTLVITIPWIVDLIKMSRWDRLVKCSRKYIDIVAYLRQLQTELVRDNNKFSIHEANRQLLILCLESLFEETVGFIQTTALTMIQLEIPDPVVGNDVLSFDTSILPITINNLSFMNHHIVELISLISKLTRLGSESLRTPGASRKLRPSIVSPFTSTFATLKIGSDGTDLPETPTSASKEIMNDSTKSSNNGGSFQSKLRDSFFHQHVELKALCEFAVSLVLTTTKDGLLDKCIRPNLSEIMTEDQNINSFVKSAKDACIVHLEASLVKKIRDTLDQLAPPRFDSTVINTATSLSVSHGVQSSSTMVDSLIETEIKKVKALFNANSRKQLFLDANENRNGSTDAKKLNNVDGSMQIVTTAIMNVYDNIDSLEVETMNFTALLRTLNISFDNMNTRNMMSIPSEPVLRSYFNAVLRLDDCSEKIIFFSMSDSGTSVYADKKWNLLHIYIQIALKIAESSRYGLRKVNVFFSSRENIYIFLILCCRVSVDDCFALILGMIKAKIMTTNNFKNTLKDMTGNYKEYSNKLCQLFDIKSIEYIGDLDS